jgi:hypothetical protein
VGSGLIFVQIKPTIIALLKKHGSARVTTLEGIEVSVRLYDERELDLAEPLLKQVLTEGPVDIRGPADPLPSGEAGTPGSSKADFTKQKSRRLLQSARRDIGLGNLNRAAELLAEARSLNSKWGLFDDTPDKVSAALRKAMKGKDRHTKTRAAGSGESDPTECAAETLPYASG